MKIFIVSIILAILLSGCHPTNIKPDFPDAPANASTCENLKLTPPTEKLSEVISVVAENYSQYYTCKATVEKWQEWYNVQKEIYDSIK